MATLITILQSVYDELVDIADTHTGVTTPEDHVGVLNRTKDIQTPFFGFEWQQNAVNRGIGGNLETEGTTTNSDGNVDGVNVSADYDLIVDIGIITDDDSIRTRDEYFGRVQERFNSFVNKPTNLHQDVERVRDEGAIPANMGDNRDVGVRKTYSIRYPSTELHEPLPPAENIDWNVDLDIDTGTKDTYPEEY